EPPPNVVQDPEYKVDAWLALREGPGTQFKIITKLGGNEYLEADTTKGEWTHITNVTRLSSADAAPNQKIVQGWARSKYVKRFACEDERGQATTYPSWLGIKEEAQELRPQDQLGGPPVVPPQPPSIRERFRRLMNR